MFHKGAIWGIPHFETIPIIMYCSHVLDNVVPQNSTVHTVRTFLIVATYALQGPS